jgi:hypothetical protein
MKRQIVTSKFPTLERQADGKEQLAAVAHPAMTDFEEPAADLASSLAPETAPNLKFEREEWTSFRTPEGLQQKAGVPKNRLRQLVLKELVDNALETGAKVRTGHLGDNGYIIEDDGPGLDGTPEQVARMFSINRPMMSTKLLRLLTRGALGNGLRVVAGAVLASEGSLVVITRNRRIALRPEHDGTTTVVSVEAAEHRVGTRIEITFGPAIPRSGDPMFWAETACRLTGGQEYLGKSSPWWYDVTQFHELLSASGPLPVRELISHLDGCTGAKAGEIVTAAQLDRALCKDITREQAERLLTVARENAKPVAPKRLGGIGPRSALGDTYVSMSGTKHPRKVFPVAQVAAFRRSPFDRSLMAVFEAVERHRHVAGARQRLACMASDKADTACNEDRLHEHCILSHHPHRSHRYCLGCV